MFFNWIRNKTRDAVLAGFSAAIEELDHGGESADGEAANRLRLRIGHRAADTTQALTVPAAAIAVDAEVESAPAGVAGRRNKR